MVRVADYIADGIARLGVRHVFLVTGGGAIHGLENAAVGGTVDTSGMSTMLTQCVAAGARAQEQRAAFAALLATPGLNLGPLVVKAGHTQSIKVAGTGPIVVDTPHIKVNPHGTLRFVGPVTGEVIVRVQGEMRLRLASPIELGGGLMPEQVLFMVDGPVLVRRAARLAGTVFGADTVHIGWDARVDGQVLGSGDIRLLKEASVSRRPFRGW